MTTTDTLTALIRAARSGGSEVTEAKVDTRGTVTLKLEPKQEQAAVEVSDFVLALK